MFKTITALYVEDEVELRNVILDIIEPLFKKIYVGTNGEDGLEIYKEHSSEIELVLTDINMPKLNGLDMATKIREIDPHIPIIVTSSLDDSEHLHKAISIGISEYIIKPISLESLVETINKSLKAILLQQKLDRELKRYQDERVTYEKFSAIGKLSAGITHEINTPLTYIKASFELMGYDIEDLEESKEKKNIIKNLNKVTDGLLRIENIITSMKEMSQKSSLKKEIVNIYSTIITSTILAYNKVKHISNLYINGELFTPTMDKHKYTYMANIHKQRVEQVWIVIINNAMDELIKFEEFKNRRLDINIIQEDNLTKVIFKDNAGGIKENMLKTLFEPFKGSKESSGMGVGLSIAKKIIDEQDATIRAYNEDNGAIFEIIFPTKNNL